MLIMYLNMVSKYLYTVLCQVEYGKIKCNISDKIKLGGGGGWGWNRVSVLYLILIIKY